MTRTKLWSSIEIHLKTAKAIDIESEGSEDERQLFQNKNKTFHVHEERERESARAGGRAGGRQAQKHASNSKAYK